MTYVSSLIQRRMPRYRRVINEIFGYVEEINSAIREQEFLESKIERINDRYERMKWFKMVEDITSVEVSRKINTTLHILEFSSYNDISARRIRVEEAVVRAFEPGYVYLKFRSRKSRDYLNEFQVWILTVSGILCVEKILDKIVEMYRELYDKVSCMRMRNRELMATLRIVYGI